VTRVLFIVSRAEPRLHRYVASAFTGVREVEIVLDRRQGERRQRKDPSLADRRRSDRRLNDVTRSLQQLGWAVVKSESLRARDTVRAS